MNLDDDEESELTPKQKEDCKAIVDMYAQPMVENISTLFNLAIE